MANGLDTIDRTFSGRQLPVCGSGVIPDVLHRPPKLEGVALTTGTYYYTLPCQGANEMDITLTPSAVSGTTAISAYPVLRDGTSIKGTETAGANAVATTQQTITLQSLRGVRYVVLKIVVATSTTFSLAEFSAL